MKRAAAAYSALNYPDPAMRPLAPLALALLLTACGDGESLLPPDARLPDGGRYRGDVVDGLLQGQGRVAAKRLCALPPERQ